MVHFRFVPAAAAAAAVLLLTAGCAAGRPASSSTGNPDIAVFRDGPPAPALSGPLDGGGRLSLAADRGHVVVLNFWGSWCTACRAEAPGLAAAASQFAAAGVRFAGVDVADNQASALAYMRHFHIGYPSVDDPGDAIVLHFHKLVPIAEFPSTLLIASDGRIAARVIGGVTYAELERLIRKVAA
jgi:thiol-disulfide isomerase/thioredoxin